MADLDGDGVLDEAEGTMRVAIMGAAQAARSTTQLRRDQAQRATRRDLEEAGQLHARLEGERAAARAELAPVHESSWWDQAQAHDVARAYETAVTWREDDEAARAAESRIRQELRDRYGVDVNESGADPSVVQAALVEGDQAIAERDELRAQAREEQSLADGITIEAEVLELSADLEDAAEAEGMRDRAAEAEHDAELSWDTAERRDQHIAGIEAGTEQPTVAAAWKQADVDNARHPREAVQGRKAKSPRARTKATAPGRQIERGR
tara:strand:+ start:1414 stop:2211 length:798 start_codon:yes stop_codon:yes gene_type:complete